MRADCLSKLRVCRATEDFDVAVHRPSSAMWSSQSCSPGSRVLQSPSFKSFGTAARAELQENVSIVYEIRPLPAHIFIYYFFLGSNDQMERKQAKEVFFLPPGG